MSSYPKAAGLRWRKALKSDIPALSDFLRSDEERRVGFSGRLLRGDGRGDQAMHLPASLRGAVWISDANSAAGAPKLEGALLCHPSRLAFPIFPPDDEGDSGLALLSGSFAPASVLGMRHDVMRYESLLDLRPQVSVDYRLMTRASDPSDAARCAYAGLALRRAVLSDLDGLLYLQEAYEREEVLTSVHEFNRAACRASLTRALERQIIFVAEEGGVFVGKAGTNARGFGVDQIGGVYTLPERRGRGVASALMTALLAEIGGSLKRSALFVKPGNSPARALYLSLGFEDIGDYRADYFEP